MRIEHHPVLSRYHLLCGAKLEMYGDVEKAAGYYRAALECNCSEPELRFLADRLKNVELS